MEYSDISICQDSNDEMIGEKKETDKTESPEANYCKNNASSIAFFRRHFGFMDHEEVEVARLEKEELEVLSEACLRRKELHQSLSNSGLFLPPLTSNGCSYSYLLSLVINPKVFRISKSEVVANKSLQIGVTSAELIFEIKKKVQEFDKTIICSYSELFPRSFLRDTLATLDSESKLFKPLTKLTVDEKQKEGFGIPSSFARKITPISATTLKAFDQNPKKHRKIAKLDYYFRLTQKNFQKFEQTLTKCGFKFNR